MFSNTIKFPIKLLRITSIWDESINGTSLTVYKVYGLLIRYLFVYVSIFCESIHLKEFESFEIFCDNFSIATSIFNISVKMLAIHSQLNKVYKFRNDMDLPIFQPRDKIERRMLKSTEQYVNAINRFWYYSITATSFMAPIVPMFQRQRAFPLQYWYPFPIDMDKDYIFYPFYVHQGISSLILGQIAASTGTFVFSTLLYFNYQIKLLGYRFSQCGYISEISHSDKYKELVECVQIHMEIKGDFVLQKRFSLVAKFHEIFNWTLFIQIGQSVLVYSLLTVLMTSMELNSTEFISKVCHLGAMIIEMAVLCFISNNILHSAQELPWQAYHCNFVEFDARTCSVLTMFTRAASQHPIAVRATGMFTFQLNLGLFLSILRTTYSYVVLIIQLK